MATELNNGTILVTIGNQKLEHYTTCGMVFNTVMEFVDGIWVMQNEYDQKFSKLFQALHNFKCGK